MEKKEAKHGTVLVQISKGEADGSYRGSLEFDNGEVLAEALAVLMQQAAIKLGVSLDMLYAKVATMLFAAEPEAGEK